MRKKIKFVTTTAATGIDLVFKNAAVGTLAKTGIALVNEFKEQRLEKRLRTFFKQINSISDKNRIGFLKELGDKKEEFIHFTLLTVEKLDAEEKVKVIGKLLEAAFLKFISVESYRRATIAVERTYFDDLIFLNKYFRKTERERQKEKEEDDKKPFEDNAGFKRMIEEKKRLRALTVTGLVDEQGSTGGLSFGDNPVTSYFELTSLGKLIIQHGF